MVDSLSGLDDNAAAFTAVATVGSTFGDVLQTSKAQAAVASFASSQVDFYTVDEHVVRVVATRHELETAKKRDSSDEPSLGLYVSGSCLVVRRDNVNTSSLAVEHDRPVGQRE